MQDIVNIYKFIEDERIPSVCIMFFYFSAQKNNYNPPIGIKEKAEFPHTFLMEEKLIFQIIKKRTI